MITIDPVSPRACVLAPEGARLTAATATAFRDAALAEAEAGRTLLVIDLAGLDFVDSSGLGALVGILKRVGARGEVVLCAPRGSVAEMIRLTRMDRVFAIHASRDEALAALGEPA